MTTPEAQQTTLWPPADEPPRVGRPRQYTDAESQERRTQAALRQQQARQEAAANIGPIPPIADPARRAAAEADFRVFCRTYHGEKFYLPDSPDHARLDAALIAAVASDGAAGPQAFAFPRGCGKTTRSLLAAEWAVLTARKRFVVLIGANDAKAGGMLRTIFEHLLHNELLAADYPEVCHPLRALEGIKNRCRSQTYVGPDGESYHTHITYDNHRLLLPWVRGAKTAQAAFYAFGIYSRSIRGTQYTDISTGEVRRPDLVILDDVQNDENALSTAQCSKVKRLIEAAVKFLPGPARVAPVIMPCTVLYENDVADEYTDPKRKPTWRGIRVSMLSTMPTNERAWSQYFDYRDNLYQTLDDVADVAERCQLYYQQNQAELEAGAVASWPENFDAGEVSAIQHAMHLFRDDEESFWSECQNRPQSRSVAARPLEPAELLAKQVDIERGHCPPGSQFVVSFVDLQDELFFWLTLAVDANYSGAIIDYGTWPRYQHRFLSKAEGGRLKGLTRDFYQAYPDTPRAESAPFEAKLYHALSSVTTWLLSREFPIAGEARTLRHAKIGIDIRWGESSAVCKRFLRDRRDPRLLGCFGQFVGASSRPMHEYADQPGQLFEHNLHPHLSESRWLQRTDAGGLVYLLNDVNALKSFLVKRLASPPGSVGSISLFKAARGVHEMLASHLCLSEAPLAVTARGRTVDEWRPTPQRPDNDLLDCAAGCIALASLCGASMKTKPSQGRRVIRRGKLADMPYVRRR